MPQQLAEWAPADLPKVRQLVNEHRRLKGPPLVLAVYYVSPRAPSDISILEVNESTGSNSVDPDKELFEVIYGSTPGFQMKPKQKVRLVLTTTRELGVASRENWPLVREIRKAFQQGKAIVVFQNRKAGNL